MAKIFITGSADGLGLLAAQSLVNQGHQVVLHARNATRAAVAMAKVPGAAKTLVADLSSIDATKQLANELNAMGRFDAIIHNAGIYNVQKQALTDDGIPLLFAVNSLAPYILTAAVNRPKRLVYLTSGMHRQGGTGLANMNFSYSDTKLHDVILCMSVARKWTGVYSNAVNPGWVPTKMGGAGAPDSLEEGFQTQVWLAVSEDEAAKVTGRYFHHKKEQPFLPEAGKPAVQEKFLAFCEKVSGLQFPAT